MKDYKKTVGTLTVLYFLAVLFFAVLTMPGKSDPGRDELVLKLNEIARDIEDNWSRPEEWSRTDYGADYVVTDPTGEVIYVNGSGADEAEASPEGDAMKSLQAATGSPDQRSGADRIPVETAIKNGYPYRYLIVNGQMLGYVILLDDGTGQMELLRFWMIVGLAAFGVVLAVIAALYGNYVTNRIYRPFRELKEFAGRVAEGKLDEPLQMDRNNLFGAFSESFDIMREELKESRLREAELQKREKELVASLSHDLKTPITGIKLTCEVLSAKLAMENGPEDYAGKVDNIYKKADQIDGLVNDLFSATLQDLGEFKVNCTDVNAKALAEIVRKYDDKGLVQTGEVPEVLVRIDEKRMSQVIGNIIANSYKYAGTKIEVGYRVVDEYLEMSIRDFGPGVPEDELGLIPGKFYRGKMWADGKEEGSGLGLYIASTLMEKMDGQLVPESPEQGLRITLMIPLS